MEQNKKTIKYNMGAGPTKKEGFINIDAMDWDGNTDIVQDLTDIPYKFAKVDSVDEILCVENLEHISFKQTIRVLKEWRRILKPGGKLTIQVPDCGRAMEYYVNDQICECVPHKPKDKNDGKADPDCFSCSGKGKIHPNRWLFSFTGAQKHPYDAHLAIFTERTLKRDLTYAGFSQIDISRDKYEWKLIAKCIK